MNTSGTAAAERIVKLAGLSAQQLGVDRREFGERALLAADAAGQAIDLVAGLETRHSGRTMRHTVTGRRFGSDASASPSAPWGALDAGNCSTVARWPSHSRVNRTTCPLGNSSASWCS